MATPRRTPSSFARRRARRGFTILELAVAIVIGMIVIAGFYQFFNVQLRQFVYQDLQMEMHQNARLATDIVSRSARMAGFGSASGVTYGVFGDNGDPAQALSAVIHRNNVGDNGSDVVTFVSMDPALLINTSSGAPPACNTTSLQFSPTALQNAERIAQYQNGELVMCFDPAGVGSFTSYLFSLSAGGDASNGLLYVNDATANLDFQTQCSAVGNLPLVMMCSRAEVATFYIDATDDGTGPGTPEHPVLMMDLDLQAPDDDDVPIVDNVEDLQYAFCLQDAGGIVGKTCNSPADWVTSITAAQVRDIYMIRMNVVVRSSREDLRDMYVGNTPNMLEDHAGGPTGDHYYRQTLTTEVVVRNLRLQGVLFP